MPQYKLGEGPYGSAYQGTIDDLFGAGDLAPVTMGGRSFGLFLGQFDWVQTFRYVWEEPVPGIRAWLTDESVTRDHTEILSQVHDLRFTGDQHQLIVASAGAGKFRDVLSNMLLYDGSCDTACLIIDPKGEIAATIGPMTEAPGAPDPRTVILDPWDLCKTGNTDALTLLDGIRAENPHCVKDARVLADAIIVERNPDDAHWAETSKNFLAALLLYLCLDPLERDERTLFRLRQIVTLPWTAPNTGPEAGSDAYREPNFTDLLGYMSDSDIFEGLIARAAQAMLNRDEKERRNILSTLERDTAFIEDPSLWKAIKSSTFDINQLVLTNKRLHVIVPFDYTHQMRSWLRLTIAAFYNACLRNQLPQSLPRYLRFRHVIIDEFAGLGKLDFIMKDIAEARGAGLKYHLVVQNFPQLRMLYGEGWENLVSNSFIRAFGVNDVFTSEYLSKMTGQATVVTESSTFSQSTTSGVSRTRGSSSSGSSSTTSHSTSHSDSTTYGSSVTFSSTGRPVLMPDEIRRIPEDRQLLFLRQMPVVMARRTPYFQTFKRFLPRHTLRDVLTATPAPGEERALALYDPSDLGGRGTLLEVNSVPKLPGFTPPRFRPYTLAEALRQSPDFVIAVAGLVCLGLWYIHQYNADVAQQHLAEARAQEAAARNYERAAEAQRLDARRAAELEAEASKIDDRLRGPYAAIAGGIFSSVSKAGMCASPGNAGPGLSCSRFAAYDPGQLSPINLSLNIRRQQFVTLSVSPQNEKRDGSFDGAAATLTVQSVFESVDIYSPDETRFHPSLRTVLASTLRAFNVPERTLENCRGNPQGLSETINGTSVSCRFVVRPPTNGGLAQFTLSLGRPL